MSTGAAQLQFGAEFALFLVALAGLGFALLRPELLLDKSVGRLAAAVGFAALALGAFMHGSLAVGAPDAGVLVALRLAGTACLVPLAAQGRDGRSGRALVSIGLTGLIVSEVAIAMGRTTVGDVARALAAFALGAALLEAGRRSISTRIAASSAAILLAVVLAMAVSLSVVISNNVEREAQRRFGADAAAEGKQANAQAVTALSNANVASQALANSSSTADDLRALLDASTSDSRRADALNRVAGAVQALAVLAKESDPRVGPIILVGPTGGILVRSGDEPNSTVSAFAGSSAVTEVLASGDQSTSIVISDGRAFGVGVRVLSLDPRTVSGAVIVTTQLDDTYLRSRVELAHQDISGYAVTLAGRDTAFASTGPQPAASAVVELSRAVLDGVAAPTRLASDRFVAARPLLAPDATPVAAVLVSVPGEFIAQTRDEVFRALFVAALASGLLALVLASVIGERIGAGVRRLTVAAGAIRSGDLHASADVRSEDELGVLSTTFDEMTGSIRGMTAELRKAADDEAVLRARLEAVVGGMNEALVAVDEHGDITDFNAAAEKLLATPARKAIGRPVDQVVRLRSEAGDLSPRLARPVLDGWLQSATVHAEDEVEVPVVVSAGTLRGAANRVVGAVFLLRDVRREQEIERMKTEFIANNFHELRTPLTTILGFASLMRTRDVAPAKVKDWAADIEAEGQQLHRRVEQLATFTDMTAGRLKLKLDDVRPRELVDGVVRRWQDRLGSTHTLRTRVARGVPVVTADRRYLDQAINELLDNARKFSPGGGRITLTIGPAAADGDQVEVAVSDQGVGIAPEKIDSIFDDFTQADGSATREFGGLGLGLALVRGIVRAHGGTLEVSSVPGKGTRTVMRLPIVGGGDR